MLSVQEALGLDLLALPSSSLSCGGARGDQQGDVITSGLFTPWGPESCPSLDQVMMMTASSTTTTTTSLELEEEDYGRDAGADEEELEQERRQRRKISNRLSAQRSRARKQQRLEELRTTAARLRAEKDGLAARLQALARHGLAVRCQNARLRAEAHALSRRVREARRILALQQRLARFVPSPMLMPMPMRMPQEQHHHHQPAGGATPAVGLASSSLMMT